MKTLILHPNFYKSAMLMENKKRIFNTCIVCKKMLGIFENQSTNDFENVPNYKIWLNHQEALKLYYNCLLKVAIEVHGYKTKYEYFKIDKEKITFPNFTDLTFKSHQAFCLNLDPELYAPKFIESKDFNGNILIWEYDIKRGEELIPIVEDLTGVYNEDKIKKNIGNIEIKHYNLKEINKENIELFV